MVLSSQAPRSNAAYSSLSRLRRRRRNRRLLALFILVVLVGWVSYLLWPEDGEGNAATQAAGTERGDVLHDTPDVNPQPVPPTRQPEPEPAPAQTVTARKPDPPKQTPQNSADPRVSAALAEAQRLVAGGNLVAARTVLNRALAGVRNAPGADQLRQALTVVNEVLVFSKTVAEGDPFVSEHAIAPGEYLSTLAGKLAIPWQFLERINGIDANRIPAGKKVKLIRGPFHAVVDKSDYRLDMYLGDVSKPESLVYVRSFRVGLGESDSTPLGRFIVKRGGKAEDPDWRNPRNTSEYYAASDPKNPIGERWVGLRGLDEATAKYESYGIHGTIEPMTIGRQASMGCVRMLDDDVRLVYDMLVEEMSTVTIVP